MLLHACMQGHAQGCMRLGLFRVESLSVGETTLFSIAPLAEGLSDTPLTIPPDLLGKYICVKAHRRVEDQVP